MFMDGIRSKNDNFLQINFQIQYNPKQNFWFEELDKFIPKCIQQNKRT